MIDIRCSREGIKCDGCPIMDKCEHIEVAEEIDPFALYIQGKADAEKEWPGIKLLGALYSEIRADVIDEYKLALLNQKMSKGKTIDDTEMWVEFKRRAIAIAEQLKEQKNECD